MIAAESMTIQLNPVVADCAINQHHYDSAEIPGQSVTFLTDINGKDAGQVPADMLKRMGIATGIEGGEWFPLTAEERTYVGKETVTLCLGSGEHIQAHMGYTALVNNRKYLAPTIEVPFDNRYSSHGMRSYLAARNCIKTAQILLETLSQTTEGHYTINESRLDEGNGFNEAGAHGCFTCTLLIPLVYAKAHAVTFPTWTRHLSGLGHRMQLNSEFQPAQPVRNDEHHHQG